ncbi:hypothetical protein COT99_02360 [Candidatus Falkowbacteria bacterium CG10_big_fil_rev_8_21_14_0_10_43_10]|uniref:Gfo/Idh/MocA family oxidoreductase n=1 Tax=Candidatus Falkowbacteria bacterium CG10_big_fil_rev_8_21_14_0_10_43_10 TaxID=1974567 RepID=A0A2H0V3Z8_9BACT|nr:MAG: hypothetical protein COT99_02360 [Candidatus Falkowbacteria bacterium CG10_big_fil_rev_8_21_14_0_10_43_10]
MNKEDLKFLQIGLGSMGKRRIRNLLFNGIKPGQIVGVDIRPDREKEALSKYGIKTYPDFQYALKDFEPDAVLISPPPDAHQEHFLYAARNKKHFFVEHTTTNNGYPELFSLLDGNFVAAPSCSWRFSSAVKKMKELVDSGSIGKILSFQYYMGQYLPDWHPWENYRDVYFSKKETGACREMFTFELIWLLDLIQSYPKEISGINAKLSDLDMDADDFYSANIKFQNGITGDIVIEVIAHAPLRTLRLIGSEGILQWEWQEHKIKLYQAANKAWQDISFPAGSIEPNYVVSEEMYQEEIKMFLDAILGKAKYPFTFQENQRILNIIFALEKSVREGKVINL